MIADKVNLFYCGTPGWEIYPYNNIDSLDHIYTLQLIINYFTFKEDMNKQGVKTTQKGVCGACKKPIVGQVVIHW